MKTLNRIFATREDARTFRKTVNAKSPAKLRDAVKVTRGSVDVWTIPEGINHGSKLSMKKVAK